MSSPVAGAESTSSAQVVPRWCSTAASSSGAWAVGSVGSTAPAGARARRGGATVESEGRDAEARVVTRDDPLKWDEDPRPEGDDNPPGYETVLFRSGDGDFSCGFW